MNKMKAYTDALTMASYLDALEPGTRQVINKPLLTEAATFLSPTALKVLIGIVEKEANVKNLRITAQRPSSVTLQTRGYVAGVSKGVNGGVRVFIRKIGAREGHGMGFDVDADGNFTKHTNFPSIAPTDKDLQAFGALPDFIEKTYQQILVDYDTGTLSGNQSSAADGKETTPGVFVYKLNDRQTDGQGPFTITIDSSGADVVASVAKAGKLVYTYKIPLTTDIGAVGAIKSLGKTTTGTITESTIPTKFEDSSDATAFFDDIQTRMNARVLMLWAKSTDDNFDTSAVAKLKAAITAYNAFIDELESAE